MGDTVPGPDGRRLVRELSERHGFGEAAVAHVMEAVAAGRGRMAQFSHPELGGSGQWMAGGMLMIGDMFDLGLKARVGALCNELADALDSIEASGGPSPYASASAGAWWPEALGTPSASGSQGTTRYAYFPQARRLALEVGGRVRVHDTLDHRIGGFSQQQGGRDGLVLSSQHGTVDPASLPLVSGNGSAAARADEGEVRDPGLGDGRATGPSPAPDEGAEAVADALATVDESAEGGAETFRARVGRSGTNPEGGAGEVTGALGAIVATGALGATGAGARDADAPKAIAAGAESRDASAADARPESVDDPITLIERLGRLRDAGLVSAAEFEAKKRELLERL